VFFLSFVSGANATHDSGSEKEFLNVFALKQVPHATLAYSLIAFSLPIFRNTCFVDSDKHVSEEVNREMKMEDVNPKLQIHVTKIWHFFFQLKFLKRDLEFKCNWICISICECQLFENALSHSVSNCASITCNLISGVC